MKLNKEVKQKINYLFDVFEKNGVETVQINFYGSGDDGNMELGEVVYKKPVKGEINWDEPTIFETGCDPCLVDYQNFDLYKLTIHVSDWMLSEKDIDYCNGQGNSGCIFYNVDEKSVKMEYVVTNDAEYEFSVK